MPLSIWNSIFRSDLFSTQLIHNILSNFSKDLVAHEEILASLPCLWRHQKLS
jgi:hypothetical protein